MMAVVFPWARGQEAASGPRVNLTCLNHDQTISRHASYPITWTAANVQADTVLSLRLQWAEQVRSGGVAHTAENSWLIGEVLDSKSQIPAAPLNRTGIDFPTIESGKYTWNVDQFCQQNRQGNKSICEPDLRYRLQIILRSADDPCADSMHCAKPRSLFKVFLSNGVFTFRD